MNVLLPKSALHAGDLAQGGRAHVPLACVRIQQDATCSVISSTDGQALVEFRTPQGGEGDAYLFREDWKGITGASAGGDFVRFADANGAKVVATIEGEDEKNQTPRTVAVKARDCDWPTICETPVMLGNATTVLVDLKAFVGMAKAVLATLGDAGNETGGPVVELLIPRNPQTEQVVGIEANAGGVTVKGYCALEPRGLVSEAKQGTFPLVEGE